MRTIILSIVACLAVLAGLAGVGAKSFQWGREFERLSSVERGKPCECKRCRCMTGGQPIGGVGDAATSDGTVE